MMILQLAPHGVLRGPHGVLRRFLGSASGFARGLALVAGHLLQEGEDGGGVGVQPGERGREQGGADEEGELSEDVTCERSQSWGSLKARSKKTTPRR
jgi:hypothetical protein